MALIKTARVDLRFDSDLKNRLQKAAKNDKRNITNLLEYIAERYLYSTPANRLTDLLIRELESAWQTQDEMFSDVDGAELRELIGKYKSLKSK